jgi:hypothetical protein
VNPEIAARLEELEIRLAAQTREYCLFVRENCMSLVRYDERGAASIGSAGMMTEYGIAYLVWRNGQPMLAAHGGRESPATPAQSQTILEFSEDLKRALRPAAGN